jgi:lysophospholipase L1-like esterase
VKQVRLGEANLALCGLPWYEHNDRRLWRFPHELQGRVSDDLWGCSLQTSGARLRFASDTTALGIAVDYTPYDPQMGMNNMHRIGQAGVDLYADGRFWMTVFPEADATIEKSFFSGAAKQMRQFTIYLPIYHHVAVRHLQFDDDAILLPPAPFAIPKPVVFYGTSITQGGCASRPGLSYQAMLSRELNLDFVNLGFSGLGKGEPEVAQALAQLDASCYVLDYGQNNPTVEDFASVYSPFLAAIRAARPDTPILLTTPIHYTSELWNAEFRAFQERRRDVVRAAYRAGIAAGDTRIWLVEGYDLLSPADGDGQVDGGHPNDIGFVHMAQGLKRPLRRALGLPS